jgi:hypothetical protein
MLLAKLHLWIDAKYIQCNPCSCISHGKCTAASSDVHAISLQGIFSEVKGTAIPIHAWTGLLGLSEFLDNRHMKVARLSALRIGRLYSQKTYLVILC